MGTVTNGGTMTTTIGATAMDATPIGMEAVVPMAEARRAAHRPADTWVDPQQPLL
jgi:hypothetical protein